jgi:hypothetical protein
LSFWVVKGPRDGKPSAYLSSKPNALKNVTSFGPLRYGDAGLSPVMISASRSKVFSESRIN